MRADSPVLVIVMVIATKKIILSIFSGIVISALMIENFQLLPALKNIVEEAVGIFYEDGVVNTDNILLIYLFLVLEW